MLIYFLLTLNLLLFRNLYSSKNPLNILCLNFHKFHMNEMLIQRTMSFCVASTGFQFGWWVNRNEMDSLEILNIVFTLLPFV